MLPRHDCFRGVTETDRRRILEGVVDELCAVGIHEFDALHTSDDVVLPEYVVLGPARIHHIGRVGPKVRVGVVP